MIQNDDALAFQESLLQDAAAEAEGLRQRARQQVIDLHSALLTQHAERANSRRNELRKELDRAIHSAEEATKRELIGEELRLREKLLDQVFQNAGGRLSNGEGFDPERALSELCLVAFNEVNADGATIQVRPVDREHLLRCLASFGDNGCHLNVQTVTDLNGGVRVVAADGRRVVDNSFSQRLLRLRNFLRPRVWSILSGPE